MSFSSLPVIDLKDDQSTIVKSIFQAGSTTGFFYLRIRDHSLLKAQQQMFQITKQFFHLPLEMKEQHLITPDNHGYVRRGQENLDSTSTNTKLIDEKEVSHIRKTVQFDQLPACFAQADNDQLVTKFHRDCNNLAMQLLTYQAQSFDIDADYFTSRHLWKSPSRDTLRLLHYPGVQSQSAESIRADTHSNYGSLTLLFQHMIIALVSKSSIVLSILVSCRPIR